MKIVALALAGSLLAALPAAAQVAAGPAAPLALNEHGWPEAWFEIFKLAPGKQEDFVRSIALADEVAAVAGQPPIQLFFHEDGADFDVILFKPVTSFKPTAEQQAAMERKQKELGLPSGPAYFTDIREKIASHTDSKTTGPVSAAAWLSKLDQWRAEHARNKKAGK